MKSYAAIALFGAVNAITLTEGGEGPAPKHDLEGGEGDFMGEVEAMLLEHDLVSAEDMTQWDNMEDEEKMDLGMDAFHHTDKDGSGGVDAQGATDSLRELFGEALDQHTDEEIAGELSANLGHLDGDDDWKLSWEEMGGDMADWDEWSGEQAWADDDYDYDADYYGEYELAEDYDTDYYGEYELAEDYDTDYYGEYELAEDYDTDYYYDDYYYGECTECFVDNVGDMFMEDGLIDEYDMEWWNNMEDEEKMDLGMDAFHHTDKDGSGGIDAQEATDSLRELFGEALDMLTDEEIVGELHDNLGIFNTDDDMLSWEEMGGDMADWDEWDGEYAWADDDDDYDYDYDCDYDSDSNYAQTEI